MFHRALLRLTASRRPLMLGLSAAGSLGVSSCVQPPQMAMAQELRRIVIDTDPGVDDTLALLCALGSPEKLKVEGLSIVLGNGKDVRVLGANAKLVLRLAGMERVPVSLGKHGAEDGFMGATIKLGDEKPVLVHGDDNIGNVSNKYGRCESDMKDFHQLSAPEFIYETCARHPGEVSLVCIGPLGNIAAALELHPDLPQLVREVIIMGGAFGQRRGNRTPAAEANFFDDPEAAQAVLNANFRKVVVAGLDVTHQTSMIALRKACLQSNSTLARFVWDVCEEYIRVYGYRGEPIAPAHDVVPVMYLLRPDLFESRHVRVGVETRGELTRGMSLADWKGQWGKEPNCHVLTTILDPVSFTHEFVDAVARLPIPSSADSSKL